MLLLALLILVVVTCIFPYIWIIIPICLLILPFTTYDKFVNDDEKRKKRLEKCRKRRYGTKNPF